MRIIGANAVQLAACLTLNARLRGGIRAEETAKPCMSSVSGTVPELVVFDLDACLWDKEMFQMDTVPEAGDTVRGELNSRGQGVKGVRSGSETISLHAGALVALQEHADGRHPGMRVALASSAVPRSVERAALTVRPLADSAGWDTRLQASTAPRTLEERFRRLDTSGSLLWCCRRPAPLTPLTPLTPLLCTLCTLAAQDTPFAEQVGRATLRLLEVLPGLTVWELLMRDWEGRDVNQIGRQPPLSANKAASHVRCAATPWALASQTCTCTCTCTCTRHRRLTRACTCTRHRYHLCTRTRHGCRTCLCTCICMLLQFPRLKEASGVGYDRMLFFDDCNWCVHAYCMHTCVQACARLHACTCTCTCMCTCTCTCTCTYTCTCVYVYAHSCQG